MRHTISILVENEFGVLARDDLVNADVFEELGPGLEAVVVDAMDVFVEKRCEFLGLAHVSRHVPPPVASYPMSSQ